MFLEPPVKHSYAQQSRSLTRHGSSPLQESIEVEVLQETGRGTTAHNVVTTVAETTAPPPDAACSASPEAACPAPGAAVAPAPAAAPGRGKKKGKNKRGRSKRRAR